MTLIVMVLCFGEFRLLAETLAYFFHVCGFWFLRNFLSYMLTGKDGVLKTVTYSGNKDLFDQIWSEFVSL